jgi:oxaloacetate decarboxylase alpha subunit
LNEDPWDRLRKIKYKIKRQTSNAFERAELLGYKHYSDGVVRKIC